MAQVGRAIHVPQGYEGRLLRPPFERGLAASLERLLAHKGEPWLSDIRARLAGDGLDVFALALREGAPVANVWLGSSGSCAESALLGHVFTADEHRRRGLAGALVEAAVREFDARGGRWIRLTTGNAAAARLYGRVGFRTILAVRRDEMPDPHLVMLRGGEGEGPGEAYHEASGEWAVEPYGRHHYPRVALVLCVAAGTPKLALLQIDEGERAELRLLEAYEAQERGECRCGVLVDAANGRAHGFACRKGGSTEVYAPRVDRAARGMLAAWLRPERTEP